LALIAGLIYYFYFRPKTAPTKDTPAQALLPPTPLPLTSEDDAESEAVQKTTSQKAMEQRRTKRKTQLDEIYNTQKGKELRQLKMQAVQGAARERLIWEAKFYAIFLLIYTIYLLMIEPGYERTEMIRDASMVIEEEPLTGDQSDQALANNGQNDAIVYRTFRDIKNITDISTFLEGALVSVLNSRYDSAYGYIGLYNKVLGGIRVRTQRYNEEYCTIQRRTRLTTEEFKLPCFKGENKEQYGACTQVGSTASCPFQWQSEHDLVGAALGSSSVTNPITHSTFDGSGFIYRTAEGEAYVADIYVNTSNAESLRTQFVDFRNSGFLDRFTHVAFVEFVTYNPNKNQHMEFIIIFEIPESGQVVPYLHVLPFQMNQMNLSDFKDIVKLVLLAGVALFTLYFIIEEVLQMFHPNIEVRLYGEPDEEDFLQSRSDVRRNLRSRVYYYFHFKFADFWEVLHLVNLLLILVQLIYAAKWILSETVRNYKFANHNNQFQSMRHISSYSQESFWVAGISGFVAWLKVFKFLRLDLRLHILWLTLYHGAKFLTGFVLAFSVLLAGFVCFGTLAFGGTNVEFESIPRSIGTMFNWILGNFELDRITFINQGLGLFFFYAFVLSFYFIGLNFFIAIMTAAFQDVKSVLLEHTEKSTNLTYTEILCGSWAQHLVDQVNDRRAAKYVKKRADDAAEAQRKQLQEEDNDKKGDDEISKKEI